MYEKELKLMETASESRNWEAFLEGLRSIVCAINHKELIKILLSYISIFMIDFLAVNSQYQAEYDTSLTTDYDQISLKHLVSVLEIAEQHKGEPGVNNFRKAVRYLQNLIELDRCDENYIEAVTYSVTNLLIAIPAQSWGLQNADLYYQWLHGTSNEDLLILARHFDTNPTQTDGQKELFQQFVGDIKSLLKP